MPGGEGGDGLRHVGLGRLMRRGLNGEDHADRTRDPPVNAAYSLLDLLAGQDEEDDWQQWLAAPIGGTGRPEGDADRVGPPRRGTRPATGRVAPPLDRVGGRRRTGAPAPAPRPFASPGQNRRLSKGYERMCATSEAFIYAMMVRLMTRRLAATDAL